MKKITAVLICAVLLFTLVSCGEKTHKDTLREVTLCLDWTPNTNHTGFYVADKLGYYEAEGIKIKIVQPPEDGAELMTASGQAQFGISFQDTLAATFADDTPLNVTAVAAVLQHNTSGIISRKGEGCDTPKGLEGKRYSTWNSPIELKIVETVMEKAGADFTKLQLLPNVVTNEAEALKNKDTDAIWIYYAWAGIAAELSGVPFDYFSFTEINEVFDYYTPVIIANNSFLKENPDVAKAFLKATRQGFEYAAENPDEAAEILVQGDDTGALKDSAELVKKSQQWIGEYYKDEGTQWGYIDSSRWDAFYGWLYDEGLIEKRLESGTGFSNDYLM